MQNNDTLLPHVAISCPQEGCPRVVSLSSDYCSTLENDKPSLAAQLPSSYEPSPYSVICGRGKDCFNHIGNRRFRVIVNLFQERYSDADNKAAKGDIVTEVLEMIHNAGGRFIKYTNGSWWEVSEAVAREKVGSLFRDVLHSQYRSSAKAKTERRRQKRGGQKRSMTPLYHQFSFMGLPNLNFAPNSIPEPEYGTLTSESNIVSCNSSISSSNKSSAHALNTANEAPIVASSSQAADLVDIEPLDMEDSWPEGWQIDELNEDDSFLFQEMSPETIFNENDL